MNKQLERLKADWEAGTELITQFEIAGTIQRVVKAPDGGYNLLRYFTISGEWMVSVDEEGMEAEAMMRRIAMGLI